ncbi:MAG: hypothetical protein H6730_28580 [Deltaproteobacteria bacterium]|nr:hypothetical protein [Deltaproteobacteria bacterium]
MLSEKDDELLGVARRADAMGFLAVWSARARSMVPHLTEQTTEVRGFQLLVEALRLWQPYLREHPEHAGRVSEFFILVEQAFARIVMFNSDDDWPLPGGRRARARRHEAPRISLQDLSWHLLGAQKTNGIWGLYRGAAGRAGLLEEDLTTLSSETLEACRQTTRFGPSAEQRLFAWIASAMDNATSAIEPRANNPAARAIRETFDIVPLAAHLRRRLIEGHDLNRRLAKRLTKAKKLDHRPFMTKAAKKLDQHGEILEEAIRCENLLSVVEAVFEWLCTQRGRRLSDVASRLPINLAELERAKSDFARSGTYQGATASHRKSLLELRLDTSSKLALLESVLYLHEEVSTARGRSAWIHLEGGVLCSNVDLEVPANEDFEVGVAWRNDYYLRPLQSIASQLEEALG